MNTQLIVTAGRVLAAPHGVPVEDGAVLVGSNGLIIAVGPRREVLALADPNAEHRAFPNRTVLPGLVNCHLHLALDASADPVGTLQGSDDPQLLAAMGKRAGELLSAGITTARDLGDRAWLAAELRAATTAGTVTGPRILTSGAPLTVPGGHCWFLGGEITDDASIRAAVTEHAARGADVIKVMVSGGSLTPGGAAMWEPQLDAHRLHVVVEAARDVGLPVAAHAHGNSSIAACVSAQVDTIEHCTWLVGSPAQGRYAPDDDLAAAIAAAGIYVCPARSRNWPTFAQLDALLERLAWMDHHGIRIVAGTDSGVPGSVFNDFAGALGLYAAAGWPAQQVLAMATTEAAAAIGLADSIGQLAPGFSADLIVVDGDPLTDLDDLRSVEFVLTRGRPHVPAQPTAA